MSLGKLFLQRVLIGAAAVFTLLTGVFALFTVTPDWYLERVLALEAYGPGDTDVDELRAEYINQRNLDRSTLELYVDWMGNMVTFQWGQSFQTGEPVAPAVFSAAINTGAYVLPALILATIGGILVGVYLAMSDGTIQDRVTRWTVYLGLGLPNFWLGALVLLTSTAVAFSFNWRAEFIPPADLPFFYQVILPALLVTTTLLAAIASYARAYALEVLSSPVVKLVRAKGGGNLAIARHVVRNAAIPLFSLMFTETLALLALSVFVIEALFGIDGLGLLFYNGVWNRDLPIILGGTLVVVATGVGANILQDATYTTLDPRVDTGTR